MASKDSAVGSVRPRSPGSPTPRPSKVQKVSGLRWSDKLPMEDEVLAIPAAPKNPVVIREFEVSNPQGTAYFTCTSGELLWGQLHTLIEGSKSEELDTTTGPAETLTGGTIIQNNFQYRAKARKGSWKVESAFIGDWHIGYVCYHEGVNGLDLLRQAAEVGISNGNEHKNREVVYVNRYDWGHWHSPGLQLVLETLGCGQTEEDVRDMRHDDPDSEYLWRLISTRFMMLDPLGLPTLIQAMKDGEKLHRKNYMFLYPPAAPPATNGSVSEGEDQIPKACSAATPDAAVSAGIPEADSSAPVITNGSGEEVGNGAEAAKFTLADGAASGAFGVNLVTAHSEYELGWMLFEKGELVGFVYDGEYSALEIYPEGAEMKLGGTVVPVKKEDSDEEDPPYAPSESESSTDSEASIRYYVGSEDESEAGSQGTSGQTGASKETAGDEEPGEETMSKDTSTSGAQRALETIDEEDVANPSEQGTDAPQVVQDEKADPPTSEGPGVNTTL